MKAFLAIKKARYAAAFIFSVLPLILFFVSPENGKFFYPLFFISAATLKQKDMEMRFLVVAAASASALILPYFFRDGHKDYPALVSQMLMFWAFVWVASEHFEKKEKLEEEKARKRQAEKEEYEELEKRAAFYREHTIKAAERIKAGKIFLSSLRNIQAQTSPSRITEEISKAVKSSFPDCRCEFKTKPDGDFLCSQVWQSRLPILVKNSKTDLRFSKENFREGEISLLSVPLISFDSVIAAAKIISDKPMRLNESDLRTCELLMRSASIAMENLELFSRINEMAMKDALTGLLTHRIFQDRLDSEILTSGRTKLPFTLIIADIDHFKKYNDTYGHQAGDEVLKKTAEIFMSSIREIDICARYGGEEFALILPQADREEAVRTAETLRKKLLSAEFEFSGQKTSVSASFGLAVFPQDAPAKSRLIRVADERLYKAKQAGRNRVVYE